MNAILWDPMPGHCWQVLMPWKERRTMGLRLEFVERAENGEPLSTLCREFGIRRTAGHEWVKRFRARGYGGLE